MRVIVTGGSGFIGSHVMRILAERGHSLTNVDYRNALAPISLESTTSFRGAEAVIHCAAKADVRRNWEPGEIDALRRDNEDATLAMLEAARKSETVRTIVFVSTGAVYADQSSPYAASKLAGEAWCRAYADRFGWRLTIVRPAACYGAGYHHGHIADFVKQARETGWVKSLTAGKPRDGLHVEDCAGWLVRFATEAKKHYAGTFYLRSPKLWGCRDTVRVMGCAGQWPDATSGWVGDGGYRVHGQIPSDAPCGRSLESGVRSALMTLGWVTQ